MASKWATTGYTLAIQAVRQLALLLCRLCCSVALQALLLCRLYCFADERRQSSLLFCRLFLPVEGRRLYGRCCQFRIVLRRNFSTPGPPRSVAREPHHGRIGSVAIHQAVPVRERGRGGVPGSSGEPSPSLHRRLARDDAEHPQVRDRLTPLGPIRCHLR